MQLKGKKIAILATHGFEQSELEIPRDRLKEQGATVVIISPEKGEIRGWEKKDCSLSTKHGRRTTRRSSSRAGKSIPISCASTTRR